MTIAIKDLIGCAGRMRDAASRLVIGVAAHSGLVGWTEEQRAEVIREIITTANALDMALAKIDDEQTQTKEQ